MSKPSLCPDDDLIKAQADQIKAQADKIKAQADQMKAQANQIKAQANENKAQGNQIKAQANENKAQANQIKGQVNENKAQADEIKAPANQIKAKNERIKAQNERIEAQDDQIKALISRVGVLKLSGAVGAGDDAIESGGGGGGGGGGGARAPDDRPQPWLALLPIELQVLICDKYLPLADVLHLLSSLDRAASARLAPQLSLSVELPLVSPQQIIQINEFKPKVGRLSALNDDSSEIFSESYALLNLQGIQHLQIGTFRKAMMDYISENIPLKSLKTLEIIYVFGIGAGEVQKVSVAVQQMTELKSLEVSRRNDDDELQAQCHFRSDSLEKLQLECYSTFAGLPHIDLNLPNCREVSGSWLLDDFKDMSYQLKEVVDLSRSARLFKVLFHGCPKLERLDGLDIGYGLERRDRLDIGHIDRKLGSEEWARQIVSLIAQNLEWRNEKIEQVWNTLKASLAKCKYPEKCEEPCCK